MKNNKGLTMISLVITVVIMLIMAAVAINSAVGDNGVITEAQKSKYLAELSSYKEQLQVFIDERIVEDPEFDPETLNAADTTLFYNTKEAGDTSGNINSVIESINTEYFSSLEIIKGELYLSTQDPQIADMAKTLGIMVSPFNIVDGVLLSTDGNLLIMDEYGSLTIPGSVREIGGGAFANVSGLKTIIIPGSCKKIGANAFAYNKTIERVVMEEGVEEIGNNAFGFSSNLQEVQMPSTMKKIGQQAFYTCGKLKSINIPEGVTEIQSWTFAGCSSLTELVLPESLTKLYSSSLTTLTGIKDLKIPAKVTSIGENAFSGCTQLENIDLTGNTKYFFSDGVLCSKDGENIIFITDKKLKESSIFSIPEGVKNFSFVLGGYNNINTIKIPASLTNIAFSQSVILPRATTEIEINPANTTFAVKDKMLYKKADGTLIYCFSKETDITIIPEIKKLNASCMAGATSVKNVTLPEGVTDLGYMSFTNAPALNVNIPSTVKNIHPMYKYSNYGTVTIHEDNPYYEVIDGVIYTKPNEATGKVKELVTFTYAIKGKFTVPSDVKVLQSTSFHNQTGMTEIELPEGLTTIHGCFGYCTALTSITIPSTVTSIGGDCFGNCSNLDKIYIKKDKNSISKAPWGAPKGDKVLVWNY